MIEKRTSTIEYPSPEMILAGEASPGRCNKAAERTKVDENAVQVKQGRRAGTGMVCGREQRKGGRSIHRSYKKKAAELLQQLSGTPRFGKRRRHLRIV